MGGNLFHQCSCVKYWHLSFKESSLDSGIWLWAVWRHEPWPSLDWAYHTIGAQEMLMIGPTLLFPEVTYSESHGKCMNMRLFSFSSHLNLHTDSLSHAGYVCCGWLGLSGLVAECVISTVKLSLAFRTNTPGYWVQIGFLNFRVVALPNIQGDKVEGTQYVSVEGNRSKGKCILQLFKVQHKSSEFNWGKLWIRFQQRNSPSGSDLLEVGVSYLLRSSLKCDFPSIMHGLAVC